MELKVKWAVDSVESEEHELTFYDDEKDPEKKWFEVNITKLGFKPIKVMEGQKIHCMAMTRKDDCRRCFYGYSGYKENYSKIEGQNYDFDTDYSSFNNNSTSGDWGQIPFILYSPC